MGGNLNTEIEKFAQKIIGKTITDVERVDDCSFEISFGTKHRLVLTDGDCLFGTDGDIDDEIVEISKYSGMTIVDVFIGTTFLVEILFENGEKLRIPAYSYDVKIEK